MGRAAALLIALVFAAPVSAEALSGDQARKQLFSLKGYEIRLSSSLTAMDKAIVKGIIPLMAQQLRQPVRYYMAIAYSPDDGLVHDSIQAAMNYHTPAAAGAAAVAACNSLKSSGTQGCKVAAQVVPSGYGDRGLTLSVDATAGFDRKYRKMKRPKAFAISRSSGAWSIAGSDATALSACERAAQLDDCEVVIRD